MRRGYVARRLKAMRRREYAARAQIGCKTRFDASNRTRARKATTYAIDAKNEPKPYAAPPLGLGLNIHDGPLEDLDRVLDVVQLLVQSLLVLPRAHRVHVQRQFKQLRLDLGLPSLQII